MSSISAYDSNSISTLFSSLSTSSNKNSSSSNVLGINLTDYATIRSGSYFKLMKAYYSTNDSTSTSTSTDSSKTLAGVQSASEDLTDTAKKLYTGGSDSVFKKISSTDEDGNQTSSYDTDKIYKALSNFVEDYNSMVSAAGKSNVTSIANTAASMINNTNSNSDLLKNIGISISSKDYSLSIDEDTFKKSDMEAVKSLFSGTGSYCYQTAVSASMLKSYADIETSKSNTYSNTGTYTYNYSTGEIYNSTT